MFRRVAITGGLVTIATAIALEARVSIGVLKRLRWTSSDRRLSLATNACFRAASGSVLTSQPRS
jgi:hypothetical protein